MDENRFFPFCMALDFTGVGRETMRGLPEVFFTLNRWKGAPDVYGLSTPSVVSKDHVVQGVNILAVDAATAKSHWLFRGYERSVSTSMLLKKALSGPESDVFVGLILGVEEADTNQDGMVDETDATTVYVYRFGDAAPVKLLAEKPLPQVPK